MSIFKNKDEKNGNNQNSNSVEDTFEPSSEKSGPGISDVIKLMSGINKNIEQLGSRIGTVESNLETLSKETLEMKQNEKILEMAKNFGATDEEALKLSNSEQSYTDKLTACLELAQKSQSNIKNSFEGNPPAGDLSTDELTENPDPKNSSEAVKLVKNTYSLSGKAAFTKAKELYPDLFSLRKRLDSGKGLYGKR